MVKYNKINVGLSDSQLNKLKLAPKNRAGVEWISKFLMVIIYLTNYY